MQATVTLHSQLRGVWTFSSIISHYLAGE